MQKLICFFLWLPFLSAQSQNPNTVLLDSFTNAINNNNYASIEPFLSADFEIKNMDRRTSLLQFYSYIHYHKPDTHTISQITASSKAGPENTDTLRGTITYRGGKTGKLEFILSHVPALTIKKIISGWMPSIDFVTRASYVEQDIFGDNPISQIKNLKLVDYKSCEAVHRNGYTVYYEPPFRDLAIHALSSLAKIDSVLIRHGIVHIKRENLLLTAASRSTVIMGPDSNLPWTISLKTPPLPVSPEETEALNQALVDDRIAHTISHEIAENSLVAYYNMGSVRFRWFRDGIAELVAFSYAEQHNRKVARDYFLGNRISDARTYRKAGHLLDWRGRGPNEMDDIGVRYGDRYLYENEAGQYGRAFRFFLDLKQKHGIGKIAALIGRIEANKQWLSGEDLHYLFKKTYNADLVSSLARY